MAQNATHGKPPDSDALRRTKPDAPIEPKPGKTLTKDEKVDEAARESMDASDPPSFTPGIARRPKQHDNKAKPKTRPLT